MALPSATGRSKADAHVLHEEEPRHRTKVGTALVLITGGILGATVLGLPRENAPLSDVARQALDIAIPHWHTLEPVNEVVYGSRGFDTFGETFLLLAAVVAIGLVTRTREPRSGFIGEEAAGEREQSADPKGGGSEASSEARRAESEEEGKDDDPENPDAEPLGTPAPERAEGMTVIVRGAMRAVSPVLAVAGCYLAAWGYSPGGGFPAGAVIAGVVLLAYVSLGYRKIRRVVKPGLVEPLEMTGALLIVLIEVGGLIWKGSFSANFLPLGQLATIPSGGILQAFSGSELIEVSTGLVLAIFGLLGMEHDWAGDDDGEQEDEPRESKAT